MAKRVTLLLVVMLPVVLAGVATWWFGPAAKSVPTYKGMTVAQWEVSAQIRVDAHGSSALYVECSRPMWRNWLEKVGWRAEDEFTDRFVFIDDLDPEAVPVLVELSKSTNASLRKRAQSALSNRQRGE